MEILELEEKRTGGEILRIVPLPDQEIAALLSPPRGRFNLGIGLQVDFKSSVVGAIGVTFKSLTLTLLAFMDADRPRVFLDVSIDTSPAGRLVIELFSDKAPKTCEKYVCSPT